jgi:hypothetical protein
MTKQAESTPTEFDRFRDFAKQIIAVPKTEIDRRAEVYKKQREAIKKAKA